MSSARPIPELHRHTEASDAARESSVLDIQKSRRSDIGPGMQTVYKLLVRPHRKELGRNEIKHLNTSGHCPALPVIQAVSGISADQAFSPGFISNRFARAYD